LENRARELGRGGNAKQRKKLQKSMDKYMKAITKQMLTIESPMQGGTKQTKLKNGKNAKGCWRMTL